MQPCRTDYNSKEQQISGLMPGRLLFYKIPHHLRSCLSGNLAQIQLRVEMRGPYLTHIWLRKQIFPFKKKIIIFSLYISPLFYGISCFFSFYSSPAAIASVSLGPLRIPPTAVQTCCYFLRPTWMCALRDSSIPHNPPFSLLHFYGLCLPVLFFSAQTQVREMDVV